MFKGVLMSKHKFQLFEYLKIKNTWEFEFEPGDQAAWDQLVSAAAQFGDLSPLDDPLCDLPRKAPKDLTKWYELVTMIYEGVGPFKCIIENERIPLGAGDLDICTGYRLLDPKGRVLDESDDLF